MVKDKDIGQYPLFMVGMVLFVVTAVFGWNKLHYGFTFVDEGYHMTESWRLAAGDHFLYDVKIGAVRLFSLINSFIFRLNPDITLLGFRKLQYIFSLVAVFLFGVAFYRMERQFWHYGFVFSIFAFAGLDPVGATANLNYYTYPHLFITLHIAFFLLGLSITNPFYRKVLYFLSGFFLWAISITLLHLSLIGLYPVFLLVISWLFRFRKISFSFKDMCMVSAPFIICWTVFLAFYNVSFFEAVMDSVNYFMANSAFASVKSISAYNLEPLKHIAVIGVLVAGVALALRFPVARTQYVFLWIAFIAVATFFVVDSSFFNIITPYWRDFYSRPMWFASALIVFYIGYWIRLAYQYIKQVELNATEEIILVIAVPCTVLIVSMAYFSTFGVLTALHCSIPSIAIVATMILKSNSMQSQKKWKQMIVLCLCLFPYYVTTAWSDWRFTYFDVIPEKMEATITSGFGKGIKTNRFYSHIYDWVQSRAEIFSSKDDYIVSTVLTPMVHMIAKRKPALAESFICPNNRVLGAGHGIDNIISQWVNQMEKAGRNPVIAFVFENSPAFSSQSLKEDNRKLFAPLFDYPYPDSLTRYITQHMMLIEKVDINQELSMFLFFDPARISKDKIDSAADWFKRKIRKDPGNVYFENILKMLYQAK